MDINLELAFVGPTNSTNAEFEAFLEQILAELEKIGREDVEVTAKLKARTAIFTVFGGDADPSVDRMLSDIRTVLHAANCATPGWEGAHLRIDAEADLAPEDLVDA